MNRIAGAGALIFSAAMGYAAVRMSSATSRQTPLHRTINTGALIVRSAVHDIGDILIPEANAQAVGGPPLIINGGGSGGGGSFTGSIVTVVGAGQVSINGAVNGTSTGTLVTIGVTVGAGVGATTGLTVSGGTVGAGPNITQDTLSNTLSGANNFTGANTVTSAGQISIIGSLNSQPVSLTGATNTMTGSWCGHMLDFNSGSGQTLSVPTGLVNCDWGMDQLGAGTVQMNFLASTTVFGAHGTVGPSISLSGISVHEIASPTSSYIVFGDAH